MLEENSGFQGVDRMAGVHSLRRFASRGFTLTELLIILAILGLLAVFGLPTLLQYSMQSRISDCQTKLRQIARLQTQWFEDHRSYAGLGDLGYPVDSGLAAVYLNKDGSIAGHASGDATYRITLKLGTSGTAAPASGLAATYYLLTAEPMNDQAKDSRCGTLSLASSGQEGATGGDGEQGCWHKSGWLPGS
jgi:type IV pilus assembly protein PilE